VNSLLAAIEAYYDAVPRMATRTEQVGPFTLFINPGPGFQYYARPTLGAVVFSAADVRRVRERQRALHVPEALEWVAEVTPGVRPAVEAAGVYVREHPLLVLDPAEHRCPPAIADVVLRLVTPEDDLATLGGVAGVAFTWPGTAVGIAGAAEVAAAAAGRAPEALVFERARLRSSRTIMVAAYVDDHPVAVGSHQPVGQVTEIVGVATLPAFRRQGIAGALTDVLVEHALRRGVHTVFLSAGDAEVARVYERLGFRRMATACVAEARQEPCSVSSISVVPASS
jgi:ribosomal protein S18 acetylase RimI-like enzyme